MKSEKTIETKAFLSAIVIIFILMAGTYLLTFFIQGGVCNISDGSIEFVKDDVKMGFFRWLLSPVLVLGDPSSSTLIAVLVFLVVVGGVFNSLQNGNLMNHMLSKIVNKYSNSRYTLLLVTTAFFCFMGAFIGSYEEVVPLVPIAVGIAITFGWDSFTGLGMSILAAGCGFASGVCNPFTVGVAQKLAGLSMFSGLWFRAVAFILIYSLLAVFLYHHAKRIEKPCNLECQTKDIDPRMDKGVRCFAIVLGIGIALVLSSSFLKALQDYTMIIVALMFLIGGLSACIVSGMSAKTLAKTFFSGVVGMIPAIAMILMAASIKFTLVETNSLDAILYKSFGLAGNLSKPMVLLFIYALVLFMNFFIASGSAKAFLLIPIIIPIAEVFGISKQLCIMAFAFGDGFSNVFYPTNPVLLISLGLAKQSYGKWVRFSGPFQLLNLLLTSAILLVGLSIGYA